MRYKELDSLRGLVALSVVIDHFLMTFIPFASDSHVQGLSILSLLKYSPLHIVWAGHEAVIFFFVLSGFVLTLPFLSGHQSYPSFLIKRVCRIYPPFVLSLVLAFMFYNLASKGNIPSLSNWFNSQWLVGSVNTTSFLNQLTLIGYFKSNTLNGVIWSLIHEMRISIIFPLLIVLCTRSNWKFNLALGLSFSYFAFRLTGKFPPALFSESLQLTTHYIGIFILGIMLAVNKNQLAIFLKNRSLPIKTIVFFSALLLYTAGWSFTQLTNNMWVTDWLTGFGASIFIIFVLAYPQLILHKPIKFLGKISYSLYLVHFPIIKFSFTVLYGTMPIWSIVMVIFPVIFLISYLSNRFIETPSMNFGRTLVSVIGLKRVSGIH